MLERLQKIIARAGIASRRHAEDLIRSGQVRVNGVVVTELGAKADPERDRVEAAGRVAQVSDTHVYLLMNKPPEVVSTLADPEGRRTLRNFLVGVSERVFPVGRLDYAAGGAVFLTNDGELASRMLKASASLPQTYWIKVKGRLSEMQLKSLAHTLRGKMFPLRGTHAAGKNPPNPWYEVQISGVRRDLLRRNLLAIGHPVEKMKRMKLASLDADTVQEGHYRQLSAAGSGEAGSRGGARADAAQAGSGCEQAPARLASPARHGPSPKKSVSLLADKTIAHDKRRKTSPSPKFSPRQKQLPWLVFPENPIAPASA